MEPTPETRPTLQQSVGQGVALDAANRTRVVVEKLPVVKDFERPYGLPLPWVGLESDPATKKLIDEWTKVR